MIIFGVSVFYIFGLIGTGQFHCPHCGGDREYEHRTARRFFTLFFLPVIPLDKVGEVVRCKTCRTKFDPIVLTRATTAQLASALPAGMRAAAALVLRAGGVNDAAIRAAVDAVHEAGEPGYDATQLMADAHQPTELAVEPLRGLAANFTQDACERQLANAVRVALADGPISQPEREAIGWIAGQLGMTAAHATGVISTVEQSITR
jgi:hypothetical protein